MKTLIYTISLLALLISPKSCDIEEVENKSQSSTESDYSIVNQSEIDPPLMPKKP